MDALIGSTGFVGGQLRSQHRFEAQFHSRTIGEAAGRSFGTVVCAAAPGSMFEANRFPERDDEKIQRLTDQLSRLQAERFVLVSSIAVLADFAGCDDEGTKCFQTDLAYGRNRRALELFCRDRFRSCLIIRLPALFGQGLRKNFLFDLLNPMPSMLSEAGYRALVERLPDRLRVRLPGIYRLNGEIGMHEIDRAALDASGLRRDFEAATEEAELTAVQFTHPDSTFQFYDMSRLWRDIALALEQGFPILHLPPEPVRAARLHRALTGREMPITRARLHSEDLRTRHAGFWGRSDGYIASADDVLAAVARFAHAGISLR